MKTNSLLVSLVTLSLSITVLPAFASSPTEETKPIALPVYVIKAERQSAAELRVERSLQQLRALATEPVAVERPTPQLATKATAAPRPETKTPSVVVAGL